MVENIHVRQSHAAQALVEAGEEVLARAEVAVRPRPHVVAGLGRDQEFVAVRTEVAGQDLTKRLLRRAVGRAVVVGEVEVRDAEIKRPVDNVAAALLRVVAAEVLPETEGDRWEQEAAAAGPEGAGW